MLQRDAPGSTSADISPIFVNPGSIILVNDERRLRVEMRYHPLMLRKQIKVASRKENPAHGQFPTRLEDWTGAHA